MAMFRIINKKVFALFIAVLLILISTASFLVFKIIQTKKNIANVQKYSTDDLKVSQNPVPEAGKKNAEISQSQPTSKMYANYDNQQYKYSIRYPDNWYINSESSNAELISAGIEETDVNSGGQTFWSNYKNINDFSPENKPEDFHLLGLTVYETQEMSSDDLVAALGFDQDIIVRKISFAGENITGTEYVADGIDEKNPKIMIIFQKDKHFYVFNLAFINGDYQVAEIMEEIVQTLYLK
jgi:hypothetical protein